MNLASVALFFIATIFISGCSSSQVRKYCSTEQRHTVRLGDYNVSYTRSGTPSGSGRPVVYVHGAYGSANDFLLSPAYAEATKKFEVITYDRPGFGESLRSRWRTVTAKEHGKILHELITELKLEKPIIIAHSWGGAVALSHAVDYPEDALGYLLVAPAAYDWGGRSGTWYDPVVSFPIVGDLIAQTVGPATVRSLSGPALKFNFGDFSVPEDYEKCSTAQAAIPSAIIAQAQDAPTLIKTLREISIHYREIKVPIKILHGDQDKTVSCEIHSKRLTEVNSNAKLTIIPGAAHQPIYTHPKFLIEQLELF